MGRREIRRRRIEQRVREGPAQTSCLPTTKHGDTIPRLTVCQGANYKRERLPFQITLADKKTNCGGLQLADLFARPIGRKMMDPATPNRAFEIIYKKLYRSGGQVEGRGLKVFPLKTKGLGDHRGQLPTGIPQSRL